jgi:hypothetical protein
MARRPAGHVRVSQKMMAGPHNGTRAICETIFRQEKAQQRRNTLCISSWCNEFLAKNFRKAPPLLLCGVAFTLRS